MNLNTVGDLVNGNPFYTTGVFPLGKDYYQNHIDTARLQETAPSEAKLRTALVQEACVTIMKEVLLVGCVLMPSILTLGTVTSMSMIGIGLMCALTINDAEGTEKELARGWISGTYFRSLLLAALPKAEQTQYLIKQIGWDVVFKTAFLGLLHFSFAKMAQGCGSLGVFYATYHLSKELEKLLYLCIKIYAEQEAQRQLQLAMNPVAAPA